jgi:hypothetical protein
LAILIGESLGGVQQQQRHVGALERAHGHQRAAALRGARAPAGPP